MSLNALPEVIRTPRTDAIYNCHAYLTKVPVAAIRPFIEHFTRPGEVVVDFFAGSGMTGLAAFQVGRKARLSDISVLGCHIADGYLARVPEPQLRTGAEEAITRTLGRIRDLYAAKRVSDGASVEMIRTVWSFIYICPTCAQEMIYYKHLSKSGDPPKNCACGESFVRRTWKRGADIPVQVVVRRKDGRLVDQNVTDFDLEMIRLAENDPRQAEVPSLSIGKEREMFSRSGLGKSGNTETARFFSARNAIALLELWRSINSLESEPLRRKLQFAFTAILPRASKRYQWSLQRPLNAQNQTYYIAPVYYEWNVFELFRRKIEAAIRADEELFGKDPLFNSPTSLDVSYSLASADNLSHLADCSVDYVFTDPPFGSNIFYSDMNLFHEAWVGKVTDNSLEAVVHTTGHQKNSSADRYKMLLRRAFAEAYRILKPGRHMSVVFGNSSGSIWGLVQKAIRDAGFSASPIHVAILDKGQRSVKGLNSGSESVVTVDLILTVKKPTDNETANEIRELINGDTDDLIREVLKELQPENARNPSYVYAKTLSKAIEKHILLDQLHLVDVLIALRNSGYVIDRKSGLFQREDDSNAELA